MRVISKSRKIMVFIISIIVLCAILALCAVVWFFPKLVSGATNVKAVVLVPMTGQDIKTPALSNEAGYLYEKFFRNSKEYKIGEFSKEKTFYLNKENIGLYSLDIGKSNAATSMSFLLNDPHFDFDDTYFILFGSCGASKDLCVPGDVFIGSGIVDYELGYTFDSKDTEGDITWYEDKDLSEYTHFKLNDKMVNDIYDDSKDCKLNTTDKMRKYMGESFNNADWAIRDPKVIKGTIVCADSYWKGEHSHNRANYMTKYYNMKDPYVATSMEDSALANLFSKMGKLDKLLTIRYAVNMDVFLKGQNEKTLTGEESTQTPEVYADLFSVANNNSIMVLDKVFLTINGK